MVRIQTKMCLSSLVFTYYNCIGLFLAHQVMARAHVQYPYWSKIPLEDLAELLTCARCNTLSDRHTFTLSGCLHSICHSCYRCIAIMELHGRSTEDKIICPKCNYRGSIRENDFLNELVGVNQDQLKCAKFHQETQPHGQSIMSMGQHQTNGPPTSIMSMGQHQTRGLFTGRFPVYQQPQSLQQSASRLSIDAIQSGQQPYMNQKQSQASAWLDSINQHFQLLSSFIEGPPPNKMSKPSNPCSICGMDPCNCCSLPDRTTDSTRVILKVETSVKCPNHQKSISHLATWVCFTCNGQLICFVCKSQRHKDHAVKEIRDVCNKFRRDIFGILPFIYIKSTYYLLYVSSITRLR